MGKQRQIDLKEDNVRLMEPEFVVNQPAIEFYVETWFDRACGWARQGGI